MTRNSTNRKGFKHTLLGWIPEDWEVKKLGDIVNVYVGRDLKENNFSPIRDEVYKYPVYSNTVENYGLYGYYNYEEYFGDSLTIVGRGVGLGTSFTRNGSYGAIGRLLVLFPKDGFYANYLTEYVNHKVNIFIESGGIPQLTGEQIAKYLIATPTLSEQKAIAALFAKWDNAIELTQKLITEKELRKKALMQKLLTGKKRLLGFTEKWKKYSYDELLKIIKRPVKWDDNELYKLISVRRRSGGIFLREELYGNQILVKDLRTAHEGDFLFSKMQILHGASALVTKEFSGAKISGSYIAVVAKDPKLLNIEFLNWYSKLPFFYYQTYISSYGVHIEKMTFDFESFLTLGITIPPIMEQKEIVNILQKADEEIILIKQKLEALKKQKKGLMQVLLTGKIRIKI